MPGAGPLQGLVDELGRLPGVGPKSAQRIAFHLLKVAPEDAARLAEAIVAVKERVTLCPRCFNVAEGDLCTICADPRRDGAVLCVVEDPRDIVAVERTGFKDKLTMRVEAGKERDKTAFGREFEDVVREICTVKIDRLEFLEKGTLSDKDGLIVDRRDWK